ncbi:hypothetical protein MXE38_07640 [Anaerobiospirillum sp. NML120448]|uniref:hypothetical protein n=1 Tax=Anaerobiospirillum sp. NML120448 TaxID=2932816 RepID=UPI001FF381E8|nr:hypothetical protein [Anaerobiospirillum sp. NML120448]MCK0514713.1 hypothetical protein [Anaerobiospirillum sp. NML120448]
MAEHTSNNSSMCSNNEEQPVLACTNEPEPKPVAANSLDDSSTCSKNEEKPVLACKSDEVSSNLVLESLIGMVIESWRFVKSYHSMAIKLPTNDQTKHLNKLRYFQRQLNIQLAKSNISIVSCEGQVYQEGMAVSAINLDEFSHEDTLIVDQVIEPIIMGSNGLLHTGIVTLKKQEGK